MTTDYTLVILDPWTNLPLRGVEVEALSVSTGTVLDVQTTALQGEVFFSVSEEAYFRARVLNRPTIYQVLGPSGGDTTHLMNVDYVVDSNGAGTHLTLFGASGALAAAIATGLSKSIWVCTTHVETVTATETPASLAVDQRILVFSSWRNRAIITVSLSGELIRNIAANVHGSGSELRFEGIGFSRTGTAGPLMRAGGTTASGVGAGQTPHVELVDVLFKGSSWTYLFDWNTQTSGNIRNTHLRRVKTTETITGIVDVSTAMSNLGTFILEDCEFAELSFVINRTNSTDLDAGSRMKIKHTSFAKITGAIGLNPLGFLEFEGNTVTEFSGTTAAIKIGTAGVTAPTNGGSDSVVGDNFIYCSQAGSSAIILDAGSGTVKNISMIGNALRGPGSGTAIRYDQPNENCPAFNAYRDWDDEIGGTDGPGDGSFTGDHGTLLGLLDDDHTQYLKLTGRASGQTAEGGTAAGESLFLSATAHATKGFVQVKSGDTLSINDERYLLYLSSTSGASADYGYTSVGASDYAVSAPQLDAFQVTLVSGIITSLSFYAYTGSFSRTGLLALYSDVGGVPTTLLAYTAQFAIDTTPGFRTAALAFNGSGGAISNLSIAAGTYWVAINTNAGGGITVHYNYDAAGVSYEGNLASLPTSPAPPENPWSGGASGTKKLSAYVSALPDTASEVRLEGDTNTRLIYDRVNSYWRFTLGGTEITRLRSAGEAVSGYMRIGSSSVPTNVTAGDLTSVRFSIGDVAFPTANIFRVSDSVTLASSVISRIQAVFGRTATLPAGGTSFPIGLLSSLTLALTANTTSVIGASLNAQIVHGSDGFDIGEMWAGYYTVSNSSGTASVLKPIHAQYSNPGGTATLAVGVDVVRGVGGDAGAITTGIGLRIGASVAVTPTTDIAIQTLGGHHRFVGGLTLGADASPTAGFILDVTGNVKLGAFYTDISQIAAPADPAAGTRRLFVDSATGEISVRTSASTTISLESATGSGSISHVATFHPITEDLATGTLWPTTGLCVGESGEHGTFTALRAKAIAGTAGLGTNTIIVEADTDPNFPSATTLFTIALDTAIEADDTVLDNAWDAGDIFVRARCTAADATPPKEVSVEFFYSEDLF